MTPTPERPDFAAAIDLLEGAARGLLMCGKRPLEERKKQATEMMDGVFALRAYPALVEEREQLRAESNGKNWQGIARIAALETENAALKDALDAARPLIEAAMGYKPEPFGHGREGLHEAAQDYQQKTSEKGEKP